LDVYKRPYNTAYPVVCIFLNLPAVHSTIIRHPIAKLSGT
jgi:hypothetical protein